MAMSPNLELVRRFVQRFGLQEAESASLDQTMLCLGGKSPSRRLNKKNCSCSSSWFGLCLLSEDIILYKLLSFGGTLTVCFPE